MTPEQKKAMDQAEALAEAEAGGNPGFSTTPSGLWTGTKNLVRSAGEGVAGLGDIGPQVYTTAKNAVRAAGSSFANIPTEIDAAWNAKPGELPNAPKPVPVQLDKTPTFYRDIYNEQFPVPQGYEDSWSRRIGNVAGPVALTLGAGEVPAIVKAPVSTGLKILGDTALTTGGTIAGGLTGGAAGGAAGGETGRQAGEWVGSLLGGSVTPTARYGGYKTAEKLFTDEESAARLKAADDANVTPDLSLTGNQRAVDYSRGAGNATIRRQQQKEIDQSLKGSAQDIAQSRGGPVNYPNMESTPPQSISVGDVGENVIKTAQNAADKVLADANRIYDPMSQAVGRRTGVDPAITRQGLEVIVDPKNGLYTDTQKATAQDFLDRLNNERRTPLDPVLDTLLQSKKARAEASLASAKPGSPLASAAQKSLDQINADIDANLGLSWEQSKTERAVGNQSIDRSKSYDKPTRLAVKEAQTAGMQEAAQKAGYTPEEFQAVNTEYGGLKGDQKALEKKIANKDEPGAYNAVFGGEGEAKKALWANLERNAKPTDLAQILAQNLEMRGRGPAASGHPELPPDTPLNTAAVDWWDKLPETMRSRYAPPGTNLRAKIDANMTLIKSDARRGGASQIEQYPGVTLGGASLVMGRPELAAANLFPKIGNYLVGAKLRDPQFTRDVITRQGGKLTPLDLARTMAAAVSNEEAGAR